MLFAAHRCSVAPIPYSQEVLTRDNNIYHWSHNRPTLFDFDRVNCCQLAPTPGDTPFRNSATNHHGFSWMCPYTFAALLLDQNSAAAISSSASKRARLLWLATRQRRPRLRLCSIISSRRDRHIFPSTIFCVDYDFLCHLDRVVQLV